MFIKPTLRYRILMIQYHKVLRKVSIFRGREKEMNFVLMRIEIDVYSPEEEIMK